MAGALAGAFAGGMSALMDGFAGGGSGAGGGATLRDYTDEDDDDEILSDEEDEEDDDEELEERRINPAVAAAGGVAVGGIVASGLLGTSHPSASHLVPGSRPGHPSHPVHPALPGLGQRPPAHVSMSSHAPLPSHTPPVGFASSYNPTDIMGPLSAAHGPRPHNLAVASPSALHHTSMAPSMSGGSVRSVDPLAGVSMTVAGVAAGAGILAPVVNSLLTSSDNKSLPKLDTSDASSLTLVDEDSLNSPNKSLTCQDRPAEPNVNKLTGALEKMHITQPEKDGNKPVPVVKVSDNKNLKNDSGNNDKDKGKNTEVSPQCRSASQEELEDDKSSVGADSVPSSEAGDGKSDTESVRKKTPSPVLDGKLGRLSPTGSDSTPVLESASCASITDLASATESMRDSDTDNHSDAHNVTANLSDLDNDLHENPQKVVNTSPQYTVGMLPIVIEKPTFGWQSMVGLDTAKTALKNLFMSDQFPEVFEGTQGTCKGVLLFGPSGSGKTCLARALAKEANDAILLGISTAFLATQSPSEAPKIVRYLFDHARMHRPAVILFDEVDALSYNRCESVYNAKAELLAQIRGLSTVPPFYSSHFDPVSINDGLMILGTTNQPWLLEDEVRRIFTYNIHIKLPGEKAREELLRLFLQNFKHNINDDQFKCLVAKSEGYSAADINTVITQVAHVPPVDPTTYIQGVPRVITYDDLASVMTEYRCMFTPEISMKYQGYIKAATHRSEDRQDDGKRDKDRPKGVKRFGQRIAKSIAAALVAVID
ncbi:Vacuolar protein sorting-associated protein 4A [Halocaridina rubra]|uniref:Vacuolar protein sorting-associated protein 4A n=1 Tax=Halocaridina rubra TaxID=373956 RepID=A0AAN8X9N3_HALRR